MFKYFKKFLSKYITFDLNNLRNVAIKSEKTPLTINRFLANIFLECMRIFDEIIIVPLKIQMIKGIFRKEYLMVNIGGGHYLRKHWSVLDFVSKHYSYNQEYIDYIFDLTSGKPFPLKNNSVKFFFSAHTLEHIPQEACQYIFNEIFRCLRIGGAIRITLPDFDKAYEAYAKGDINFFRKSSGGNIQVKFLNFFATYFKNRIPIEEIVKNFKIMKKKDLADYYTQKIPRDYQKKHPGDHINWWNFEKAKRMLFKAGFRKIFRSKPQKSQFHEMRGRGRNKGFDSTHPEISFFLEAIK